MRLTVNGERAEHPEGLTVSALLAELKLDSRQPRLAGQSAPPPPGPHCQPVASPRLG